MKKIIWLLIVLVLGVSQGFYAKETTKEPTKVLPMPFTEADDVTLFRYALQLQKTRHELFAGVQRVLVLGTVPESQG